MSHKQKRQTGETRPYYASEELYRALFEQAADGIFIADTQGRFLEVNPQGCELLGYSREGLVQLSWSEVLVAEEPTSEPLSLDEGVNGKTGLGERRLRCKDGRLLPVEIRWQRLADGRLLAFVRDISERKQVEEVMQRYELFADHSRDIILVVGRSNGRILEANATATKTYGYSREELLALSVHDLRSPEMQALTAAQMAEADTHGILFETVHRRQDGRTFPVEVSSQGATIGGRHTLISVVRDISERKRTEEQLLYQANLLRNVSDAIIATDLDFKITSWNEAAEALYGWKAAEVLGQPVDDLLQTEFADAQPEQVLRQFLEQGIWRGEAIQKRKDNDRITVLASVSLVKDGAGQAVGAVAVNRDMSEHKRAEAEIQKLAKFPNENPNPVLRISQDGLLLYANPASTDLLESWNCTLGRRLPDEWSKLILETHDTRLPREEEVVCKDRVFSLVLTPVVDDNYVNIYGYDITARKQAETARQASEARLTGIIESAMDAIISVDEEQRIVLFNSAAEQIFGYPAAEVLGQPLDHLIPARFHESHREHIRAFGQAGVARSAMGRFNNIIGRRANGEEFPLEASISQIEIAGAKLYTVVHRDITERERAEKALRESEEKYASAFRISPDSINLNRMSDGLYLDVNEGFTALTGYTRQEVIGQSSVTLNMWADPRDRARLMQGLRERGEVANLEAVFRLKDGTLRTGLMSARQIEVGGEMCILSITRDITERKRAEEALRQMAENMAAAQRMTHFGSWEIGLNDELEFVEPQLWSDECYRIFGVEPGSIEITKELFYGRIHSDDRVSALQALFKAIQERTEISYEYRIVRPDGAVRYIHDQAYVVLDERTGQPVKVVGTAHDITERKQAEEARAILEEQLRQAHKMESVGRLAGGIAHDFNNLLTVIRGYCDLMQPQLPNEDPLLKDLEQIRRSAERAAALTRQLLAFSRNQILAPTSLDLNDLVTNLHKMLGRLIGEDINLVLVLQPGLWSVKADPGQIEQVIVNLAANARDAMPTGGMLTIETRNVHLDDSYLQTRPEAPTGSCVMLAVTDTGHGIDASSRAHVFEPFFTTKEVGQGTGLGLATAYGIIKQSGGDIMVYSEPGYGTTFKIYLPASETVPDVVVPQTPPVSHAGTETILLVEDEEEVRNLVGRTLKAQGYTILEARHGDEALSLASQYQGSIDLLLTDVVMPQMSGRELAEQLMVLRPRLKVLFISGYTDDAIVRHGVLAAEVEYLSKPFSPSLLASKVRQVLDQ